MTILVTGSAGHLGEALMRLLRGAGGEEDEDPSWNIPMLQTPVRCRGLDVRASPFTDIVGSVTDPNVCRRAIVGQDDDEDEDDDDAIVTAIIHTASLHKPHVETHSRQDFVNVNVTGTLNLLEAAVEEGQRRKKKNQEAPYPVVIFVSTTSTFGDALQPTPEHPDATWIDETIRPIPKNIYGVTKLAAEDLCSLFHRLYGLPCLTLKVSRFFPEPDDAKQARDMAASTDNAKLNELLYRRADIYDMATACLHAVHRAPVIGHDAFLISSDSPFSQQDLPLLTQDAAAVIQSYYPETTEILAKHQFKLFPIIDRVYRNDRAKQRLGWQPRFTFAAALKQLREHQSSCQTGKDQSSSGAMIGSKLSRQVGEKGYHYSEDGGIVNVAEGDQPFPTRESLLSRKNKQNNGTTSPPSG